MSVRRLILFSVFAFTFVGCRLEDEKSFTLFIPDLTKERAEEIKLSLADYSGVREDSYVFDYEKSTFTLRYDSMSIAKENIYQAIEGRIHEKVPRN